MGLKEGWDLIKQVRGPKELLKMALPTSMRTVHILNEGEPDPDAPTTGQDIIKALKALRNELKAMAYVDQGAVNYKALAQSDAFEQLVSLSRTLPNIHPEDLKTDDERIAFFINLYNVLMIHGVIAMGIEHSVMEIPTFFSTVAYQVGEHILTPDDMEHGILRRNVARSVSHTKSFEADDPRLQWMPSKMDPRIHLALVCVAQSCPPIGFYNSERLDTQLQMASANYVNNGIKVDHDTKTLHVAAIFTWYKEDFGGTQGLIEFWSNHANEPLLKDLTEAVQKDYNWKRIPYNWELNTL